jgi:hypothetical protein
MKADVNLRLPRAELLQLSDQGAVAGFGAAKEPLAALLRHSCRSKEVQPEVIFFAESEHRIEAISVLVGTQQDIDDTRAHGQRGEQEILQAIHRELELEDQQVAEQYASGEFRWSRHGSGLLNGIEHRADAPVPEKE